MATNTNTNTNETVDALFVRAGSVNTTRYAVRTAERVKPKRFTDAEIVRDVALVQRVALRDHGAPMGWVECLRTLRWNGMARCDQRRFRGAIDGTPNLHAMGVEWAKSKRKIK